MFRHSRGGHVAAASLAGAAMAHAGIAALAGASGQTDSTAPLWLGVGVAAAAAWAADKGTTSRRAAVAATAAVAAVAWILVLFALGVATGLYSAGWSSW